MAFCWGAWSWGRTRFGPLLGCLIPMYQVYGTREQRFIHGNFTDLSISHCRKGHSFFPVRWNVPLRCLPHPEDTIILRFPLSQVQHCSQHSTKVRRLAVDVEHVVFSWMDQGRQFGGWVQVGGSYPKTTWKIDLHHKMLLVKNFFKISLRTHIDLINQLGPWGVT